MTTLATPGAKNAETEQAVADALLGREHARAVSEWLRSGPGCFRAPSANQAIRRAHRKFTKAMRLDSMSVADLKTALFAAGYKPEPFRDHGTGECVYRLQLPEQ